LIGINFDQFTPEIPLYKAVRYCFKNRLVLNFQPCKDKFALYINPLSPLTILTPCSTFERQAFAILIFLQNQKKVLATIL
jgi:hypothetical protein